MALDRREDERLTLPNSTSRKYLLVLLPRDRIRYSPTVIGLVGFDGVVFEVTDAAQVAMVVLY